MIQKFSYHTHTTYSDGRNTAEDMVLKAKELGWEQIGISDHLIVHKNIKKIPDYGFTAYKRGTEEGVFMHSSFASIKDEAKKHFENLDKLATKHGIRVLKGFEVDYFTYSGWEDELKDFLKDLQPDYLANGNHFFFDEDCNNIFDMYYIKHKRALEESELTTYITRHYQTVEKAIKSGLFDFVAHLDYSRNVGSSMDMFKSQKLSVVKILAECDVATEVSTKGIRKHGQAYPADWLLAELKNSGVKLVVSDDAHKTTELGTLFCEAESLLGDYPHRLKL